MMNSAATPSRALALLTILLAGCSVAITPPAAPADPVNVLLLDHGYHPSLLLPDEDDGMIQYVYGEWDWMVLGRNRLWDACATLLWPTDAALGRRELADAAQFEHLKRIDPVVNEHIIVVERQRVRDLRRSLDQLHQRDPDAHHFNPSYHLTFAPHPSSYHLFSNSNHMLADWLRALDCRVQGMAMYSNWRIVPAKR